MNAGEPKKLRLLERWAKFNAVGALGFGLQLFAVSVLIRSFKIDPLIATALAVEMAVLHNFIWHHLLTWSDRRRGKWRDSLLRLIVFNVTNGAVSIAGNLFFALSCVAHRGAPMDLAAGRKFIGRRCFFVNQLCSQRQDCLSNRCE